MFSDPKTGSILFAYFEETCSGDVDAILAEQPDLEILRVNMWDLSGFEYPENIDVIVADLSGRNDRNLKSLALFRKHMAGVPIFIVSETIEEWLIRDLLKLRIRDWMQKPIAAGKFLKALKSSLVTAKSDGNQVHAVVSASAGAGGTTVAASIAVVLAQNATARPASEVALFDLDFSSGDCGYLLNLPNSVELSSVCDQPQRVDTEFVNIIQKPHPSGFNLFSFKKPFVCHHKNGTELVLRMLDAVCAQHKKVVVDVPYYSTPWKDQVLAAVNSITVVARLTIPSVKHAQEFITHIRTVASKNTHIRVILNQTQNQWFRDSLPLKTVQEVITNTKLYSLPYDKRVMDESANRGLLPSEISANCRFVKKLRSFATETLELGRDA